MSEIRHVVFDTHNLTRYVQAMHAQNRLLHLRKSAGLTQDQLAEKLGVDRSTVSRWESCEAPIADRHKLALSVLLGVSPAALMGWDTPAETAA